MKEKNYTINDAENDFLILSAKALGWYRNQHKNVYTLKKVGEYLSLSASSVSKYLIDPKEAEELKTPQDLKNSYKTLLPLHYALRFAEAMESNLWDILHLYNAYMNDSSKSTKLNEEQNLKKEDFVLPYNENLLTDVNDPLFRPWLGEFYDCVLIPESTINNWKFLGSSSRDRLRILMRKHSLSNWYYKANNKNAEEILYIIEEKTL